MNESEIKEKKEVFSKIFELVEINQESRNKSATLQTKDIDELIKGYELNSEKVLYALKNYDDIVAKYYEGTKHINYSSGRGVINSLRTHFKRSSQSSLLSDLITFEEYIVSNYILNDKSEVPCHNCNQFLHSHLADRNWRSIDPAPATCHICYITDVGAPNIEFPKPEINLAFFEISTRADDRFILSVIWYNRDGKQLKEFFKVLEKIVTKGSWFVKRDSWV